jgi:hypothetical protein
MKLFYRKMSNDMITENQNTKAVGLFLGTLLVRFTMICESSFTDPTDDGEERANEILSCLVVALLCTEKESTLQSFTVCSCIRVKHYSLAMRARDTVNRTHFYRTQ